MTGNPYQSSATAIDEMGIARTKVFGPAVALLTLSILTLIPEVFFCAELVGDTLRVAEQYRDAKHVLQAISLILVIVMVIASHIAVAVGARKMLALQDYWLATTAALLSVIPVLAPAYVLAIPFGIWAIATLRNQTVLNAFCTIAR